MSDIINEIVVTLRAIIFGILRCIKKFFTIFCHMLKRIRMVIRHHSLYLAVIPIIIYIFLPVSYLNPAL